MKRLLRIGKWALLTVLGMLLGVVIFLHTSWGRSFLRARIESALAGNFPGSTVKAVEGSPFTTLTVKGIVVMGKDGRPLATVGSTEVDVSLLSLVSKVVRVNHVVVSDVMIAPGNLPVKKDEEPPSPGGGTSWTIEATDIAVHRATVVLPDETREETIRNIELAASVRMPAGEPLIAVAAVKATWRGLAVEATAYARKSDTLDIPFANVAAGAGGATVLAGRIGDDYTGDAIARISPALATVLKIEGLPGEVLAMAHAQPHGHVSAFAALGDATLRAAGVVDLEKRRGSVVAVVHEPRYGAAIAALECDTEHARGMITGETLQQGQLVRTLVAVTGTRAGGWLTLGVSSDAGYANTVANVTRTGDAFELATATLTVHGKRIALKAPDGADARASGLDVKVTAKGPLWPEPKLHVDGSVVAGGVQYDSLALDGALVRLTGVDITRTQAVGRVHAETVGMKHADTPVGSASLDARVTAGFDGTLTALIDHHQVRTDVGGTWAGSGGAVSVAPDTIVVKDLHTSSGAGVVTANAKVTRETGDLVADVTAKDVGLATLAPGVAGTVSATAHLARKGLAWDGMATFAGKGVVAGPDQPPIDARGSLTIHGRRVVLTTSAMTPEVGEVRVAAEVDGPYDITDVPAWKRLERRAIRSLAFTAVDVKLAGAHPKLSGVVEGGVAITATGAHGTLHLHGFHTSAGDVDGDLTLGVAEKPEEIATTETVQLVGVAGADAVVHIALPRYVFDPKAWKALGARVIADGSIHAKGVQVTPEVVAKLGAKAPYHATVDLDAEIAEGATGATLALDVKGFAGGKIVKPVDVHIDGNIDGKGAHAGMTASTGDLVLVEAAANAPLTVDDVQLGRVRGAPLTGSITIGKPQVPAKDLLAIVGRKDVSAGTIDGTITIGGTVLAPTGSATITTRDVTVPSQIEGRPASKLANLVITAAWSGTEGQVDINGREGKTGVLHLYAHGPLQASKLVAGIEASDLDIAPFAVFAPGQFAAARGTLTAQLKLFGFDPDTGDLKGTLQVRKGRLPLHDLIGTLREADIDVMIGGHKIDATLKSKLGPGTVDGSATVTLAGSTPKAADVKLTIRQISLIRAFQPRIDADVTAHLTHTTRWTGDVAIDNGHVLVPTHGGQELLDSTTPTDMLFVDGEVPKVAPLVQRPPPSKPWLVANVALGRTTIDVLDEQYQVNGALTGKFVLSLGGDGIGMDGAIDMERGDIELLGQRSQLDHGSLVFDGTIDPMLNIRVVRDLADVTVAAEVTGRLSNYHLDFTSDSGSYSQGELLAMFAGGSSGGDNELGQAAATAGAGYLSSILTAKLQKALPLNLKIKYTPGGATTSDAVGIGRWIGRNLYLEGSTHPEARPDENANEGIIEYRLGPFILQGDAGDRGYAGAEFGGRVDW